jgi:hypothetical protein
MNHNYTHVNLQNRLAQSNMQLPQAPEDNIAELASNYFEPKENFLWVSKLNCSGIRCRHRYIRLCASMH